MGAEMVVVAVGPGTNLGWVLDAQRALARADRAVASAWLF
jgi:precorrin-3B methylase